MLYFAYGSNLDWSQIKDRTAEAKKKRGSFFKRYNKRSLFRIFSSKPDPFSLDMDIM